ncbi:MAG: DMT family transporter [Anaerolineaceae bacterium]|nr:DMT family transporter [Anaerolineaceae bacterium]
MKDRKESPFRSPAIAMVGSVLAASTGAIFIRLAQNEAPSLVIAAYRLGIAAIILAPFALLKNRDELKRLTRRQLVLVLLSGVFLAFHFGSWITSLEYTTVTSSVVLVSMSPLIVALLSTFLLGESLSILAWGGLFLALTGSVIVGLNEGILAGDGTITWPDLRGFLQEGSFLGNLLAFAGAVFIAGNLIIGRKLRASYSLVTYATLVFGVAACVLLLAALLSGQSLVGYSSSTYIWMLALAVIPQIFGHAVFNWALGFLSASFVSIALLGEPIGASVIAFFILNEVPSILELVGGGLILFGIYLASR